MTLWSRLRSWMRATLLRSRMESEMDAELRFHMEAHAEDLIRGGVPRQEALRRARLEFGGIDRAKEECREARGANLIETLAQDMRFGARMLRKNPGFAVVAILTLALGVGVNTTIFSLVSAFLLRKPPLSDPDRVMMLRSKNPAQVWAADRYPVSVPDFIDWRTQSTSFAGVAGASFEDLTLSGEAEPERVPGGRVSSEYFSVLGITPVLGRAFTLGEDQPGRQHVAMLSEGLWRRRFGADPQTIGRTIRVNGEAYEVVGIVPSEFQLWSFPAQIWMPLVFTGEQLGPEGRKERFLSVFARLRQGITERQAQADLTTIANRLAVSNPQTNKGWGANVKSLQEYSIEDASAATAMLFLMATVGFVLLIACANLANLLLARSLARRHEFAIRAALGARRARLVRQLLSECLLLSLVGGGFGMLIAYFGAQLIRVRMNWNEYAISMARTVHIDTRVLVFTLLVSAASALVFGLAPALQISRADLNNDLKEGLRTTTAGRKSHRFQSLLVIGELAVSLILLTGAGLFAKAFIEELQTSLGINPQNVITATVALSGPSYKEPPKQVAFFQEVLRRLADSPQVSAAAVTTDLPLTFPGKVRFTLEGHPNPKPDEQPAAGYYAISPGYFAAIQAPLLAGREFTASNDATSAPAVIVDAAFARKYFANENPVGRHIRLGSGDSSREKWSEIVGIVADVSEFRSQNAPRPHIFAPFLARPDATMHFVVRTRTETPSFGPALRSAVWAVDKEQAVAEVKTMNLVVENSVQGDDLMAALMSSFAGFALALAAVGIYGLLAYLVGQRTHEIGVRMALGARRSMVVRLVMRGAMSLVLPGVAAGFLISLALPKLFAASFPGYRVHAISILVGAPLVVILVALTSCYLPARRSTRVDPMVALRHE
jgi:putative ABC transport system permease protein